MSDPPNKQQLIEEISVTDLAVCLAQKENLQLIDVRERAEVAIACLPEFEIFPLSEFADWSDTIKTHYSTDAETLVMCHHGMRSAQMCQWLIDLGFTNVKNIAGGIDAYSRLVDSSIPRY